MLLEGNMSLKNPVTPQGIDPGTVRLVAQRLNNYATPGPLKEQECPMYCPLLKRMQVTFTSSVESLSTREDGLWKDTET
jgi:hypothetical protein